MAVKLSVFALLILFFTSCGLDSQTGNQEDAQSTTCPAGAAIIQISDGYMRAVCGCAESSVTPLTANLACTIPSGTSVIFMFQGSALRHQISPTGSPSFSRSSVYDPKANPGYTSHVVHFETMGTYGFEDDFVPGLSGQIIVQ